MYFRLLLSVFFACVLWLAPLNSRAQNDLREYNAFFIRQLTEYQEWLGVTGFNQVLRADSLQVARNNVTLFLGSPYNDTYTREKPDSLSVAWENLKNEYFTTTGTHLYEELFNTFFFLMEIDRQQAEIQILGKESFLFRVQIDYQHQQVVLKEEIATIKANGTIEIPPIQLKNISKPASDQISDLTLREVRENISSCLTEYYSEKGTILHDAEIRIIADYAYELVFEVTKLSNEILRNDDWFKFFEYIRIAVKVEKHNGNVAIVYDIQGKYGSGIFCPPRRNEYKSIEVHFPGYMDDYEIMIKNKIRKYLTE